MPHAVVSDGATLHFQFTASSSPGSTLDRGTCDGGAVWDIKLPQASQKGPTLAKEHIMRGRMTIEVSPNPGLVATEDVHPGVRSPVNPLNGRPFILRESTQPFCDPVFPFRAG
jgi:hypothetical protein